MEPGIAPLVAKLNELGVRTVSCCEGHAEKECPDAFVSFVADEELANKIAASVKRTLHSLYLDEIVVDLQLKHVMHDQTKDEYCDCVLLILRKFSALRNCRASVSAEIAESLRL